MTEESSTRTLGSTTIVFGWVEKARVEEALHAADGFQGLLAVTLALFGASVAAGVALAAGALHPIAMYLILCGLLTGTALLAVLTVREFRRYHQARKRLLADTVQMQVPMTLSTPGAPSFSVGGSTTVTAVTGTRSTVQQQSAATTSARTNPHGPDQAS